MRREVHSVAPQLDALTLDDHYVPYLKSRRLRSLGSASDHPRLVAAYVLALAQTSIALKGPHPGFVVLDEPLQQNPDPEHREMALSLFASLSAVKTGQVIMLTSLRDDEIAGFENRGIKVDKLAGEFFLQPLPGASG